MKKKKFNSFLTLVLLTIFFLNIILFSCSGSIQDKKLFKHVLNENKTQFISMKESYIEFDKNNNFKYLIESPDSKKELPFLTGKYTRNDKNLFLKFDKSVFSIFETKYKKIDSSSYPEKLIKQFQSIYNFKYDNDIVFSTNDLAFYRLVKINTPGRELDGIYLFNIENDQNIEFLEKDNNDKEYKKKYEEKIKNYIIFKFENNKVYNFNQKTEIFEEYSEYKIDKDLFTFDYKFIKKDGTEEKRVIILKYLKMQSTEIEYIANKSKFEGYKELKNFSIEKENPVLVTSYFSKR